jgi:hypothetical protein
LSFSFGAVVVIVNLQYTKQGFEKLPETMRDFVDDVNAYMNNSAREARVLMVDNYKEVRKRLFTDLDRKYTAVQ